MFAARLLAVSVVACLPSLAAQVQIKTTIAGTGRPLKDTLVIVQDLDHQEREIYRVLTDGQGGIPQHDLPPGLYRAIGTYPHSRWHTDVREFVVASPPVTVDLQLSESTALDTTAIAFGKVTVRVLDAKGKLVPGARVLVRDADATPQSEHWGTTDAEGKASLELTLNPAVFVVVYQDRVYTFPANTYDTERTLRLP